MYIGNKEIKDGHCLMRNNVFEFVDSIGYASQGLDEDDLIQEENNDVFIQPQINGNDMSEYTRIKVDVSTLKQMGFNTFSHPYIYMFNENEVHVMPSDQLDTFRYKTKENEFIPFEFIDDLQDLYFNDYQEDLKFSL